jgi:PTH1 family peptidyl-tRNA hydrolase
MIIISCLGNPGKKYLNNRHNAGCILGKYISGEFNIPINRKSTNSIYGTGKIDDIDVLIQFPQTFMNRSGAAVKEAINYYEETPDRLIVIHDEIELPFGEIKTKFGGGHKGHNGLRSIIQEIGSPDFHRIRIGVGRPGDENLSVADHVLSNFDGEEYKRLKEAAPVVIEKIKKISYFKKESGEKNESTRSAG